MWIDKIIKVRRITVVFISLLVALVTLTPRKMAASNDVTASGITWAKVAAQDPSAFLEEFEFLPGSAVLIEDHYILAWYENSERELYALVMFTATCDPESCVTEDLIAYSIFDAQGQDIQVAKGVASPLVGQWT